MLKNISSSFLDEPEPYDLYFFSVISQELSKSSSKKGKSKANKKTGDEGLLEFLTSGDNLEQVSML